MAEREKSEEAALLVSSAATLEAAVEDDDVDEAGDECCCIGTDAFLCRGEAEAGEDEEFDGAATTLFALTGEEDAVVEAVASMGMLLTEVGAGSFVGGAVEVDKEAGASFCTGMMVAAVAATADTEGGSFVASTTAVSDEAATTALAALEAAA